MRNFDCIQSVIHNMLFLTLISVPAQAKYVLGFELGRTFGKCAHENSCPRAKDNMRPNDTFSP
jgi:hypothetical protein